MRNRPLSSVVTAGISGFAYGGRVGRRERLERGPQSGDHDRPDQGPGGGLTLGVDQPAADHVLAVELDRDLLG